MIRLLYVLLVLSLLLLLSSLLLSLLLLLLVVVVVVVVVVVEVVVAVVVDSAWVEAPFVPPQKPPLLQRVDIDSVIDKDNTLIMFIISRSMYMNTVSSDRQLLQRLRCVAPRARAGGGARLAAGGQGAAAALGPK